MATLPAGGSVGADAPSIVVHDDAGSAPHIGLIGDSTLAGVRWMSSYGDLRQYNFVFDAESCRRTLDRSCWSREDYRPETALQALQRHSGEWGEVLVVMSGYNDVSFRFDEGVDAIIIEARRQGIGHVIWLTLRTSQVDYDAPGDNTNSSSFDDNNEVLLAAAVANGGYLQIADWDAYSAERPDWFSSDGVHLSEHGAEALTAFIANHVAKVLDGETITPVPTGPPPTWVTVAEGERGASVANIQQALIDAGAPMAGGVDGDYGTYTASAVRTFQRDHGLEVTGVVDTATAIALGVFTPRPLSHVTAAAALGPAVGTVVGDGSVGAALVATPSHR